MSQQKQVDYAIAANMAYAASEAARHPDDLVEAWLAAEQAFQASTGTLVDTRLAWTTAQDAAGALRQRRLGLQVV